MTFWDLPWLAGGFALGIAIRMLFPTKQAIFDPKARFYYLNARFRGKKVGSGVYFWKGEYWTDE